MASPEGSSTMKASTRAAIELAGVIAFVGTTSPAFGGQIFTHNFDMRGNYQQYLYSTTNAFVDNEAPSFPDVTYWAPATNNAWATIEYRYALPFVIGSASIYANIHSFYVNLDPG